MTNKAAEQIALGTLNRLIDDQLQACTEPYKEDWVKKAREHFFKFDTKGYVIGVAFEGSQYVMPADNWFTYFAAFKRLEYIHLDWCGDDITGKGLRFIKDLKRMKFINFWTCSIKDSVLVHLLPLIKLEWLRLSETDITDKGLRTLARLPRLRGLELWKTSITDKGLIHLRDCKSLEYLDLNGTEVTEAGVKELTDILPSCRIQSVFSGGYDNKPA